jgi:hypothetical protein
MRLLAPRHNVGAIRFESVLKNKKKWGDERVVGRI